MNTAIKPRAYDLADAGEVDRLLREVAGYLETCRRQHHGTDFQGRMFAADAMREFPATIAQLRAEVERLREDRDSHQRIAITAMTRADKAEAALAKVRGLLQKVVDAQAKHYGDGTSLHLEMIDLAATIRASLTEGE